MPMESSEKKHAYAGRQCSACGGKACNISYEALRDMVEKKPMAKPMPRFADGGPVSKPSPKPVAVGSADDSRIDPDKRKVVTDSLMKGFGNYAEGGDVEHESGDDSEMLDHCVGECMEAMKSGDKAAFKDAMYVMMADMMRKMGKED